MEYAQAYKWLNRYFELLKRFFVFFFSTCLKLWGQKDNERLEKNDKSMRVEISIKLLKECEFIFEILKGCVSFHE